MKNWLRQGAVEGKLLIGMVSLLAAMLYGGELRAQGTATIVNGASFRSEQPVAPGVRPVVVTTGSGTLNGTVRVVAAAPGIFRQGNALPALGAILKQDSSANAESRPAIRGQAISIYATGQGALSATVADGAAAPSNPPATATTIPQVFIAGVEVPVEFSGLAPGFAGLWQINVHLPNLPFLSGRLPVLVYMNGVDSNVDINEKDSLLLTSKSRALLGQSRYIWNVITEWNKPKWNSNARFMVNYVARRISDVGTFSLPDIYQEANTSVDFSYNYSLSESGKWNLRFEAENLTDNQFRWTQGDIDQRAYRSGRGYQVGVSYSVF